MGFDDIIEQIKRWAQIVANTANDILQTSNNKEDDNDAKINS